MEFTKLMLMKLAIILAGIALAFAVGVTMTNMGMTLEAGYFWPRQIILWVIIGTAMILSQEYGRRR